LVFLLWGAKAEKKKEWIDQSKHLVLIAPHPSPLSAYRGFFGCRHFSQTNAFLLANGKPIIRW
jgi:uracil-DNA glycosylase